MPVHARSRRRQESGPLQGPPASRPVRGPRTLRSFASASVRCKSRSCRRLLRRLRRPRHPLLSLRKRQRVFVGAKCHHAEPQCFSTVITRIQRPCCASILPPYAAPLLGRSLSGSQQSRERASSLPPFPLLGTASPWSNLAAIPPGLVSLRLDGSVTQSLPGVPDTAVPAVGADKVRINRP